MQFDTSSPVPKVMFSPASAINPDDVEDIQRHAKSTIAESCVKMNVYQVDDTNSNRQASRQAAPEPEAPPVFDSTESESDEPVQEPVRRESKKPADTSSGSDVPDIIKKWSKKS
jgi:hypothetical protein